MHGCAVLAAAGAGVMTCMQCASLLDWLPGCHKNPFTRTRGLLAYWRGSHLRGRWTKGAHSLVRGIYIARSQGDIRPRHGQLHQITPQNDLNLPFETAVATSADTLTHSLFLALTVAHLDIGCSSSRSQLSACLASVSHRLQAAGAIRRSLAS